MTEPLTVRPAQQSERDAFNEYVAAHPAGDVLQSWEWGEVKARSGWAARRLLARRGDRIVGSVSALRTRPVKGFPPILYAPRGPMFDDAEALVALIAALRSDTGGAFMLKADPCLPAGSTGAADLQTAGFRQAGGGSFGGVQPKAVMVLDIDAAEDKLLEGFKQKWRYNIRLAEKRGVTVEQASREELPVFYDLLLETAKRDGFFVRGRSYFETLHDVLAPAGMLSMWLARFEGRAIAGAICFRFGPRVTYVYGASSNTDRKVMPNHLMQWTMIRHAKEQGASIYDFRGVSPVREGEAAAAHIAGLNRFKEGFGARYVEYAGDMDLPLRPLIWRAWVRGAPTAIRIYKKLRGGSGGTAE